MVYIDHILPPLPPQTFLIGSQLPTSCSFKFCFVIDNPKSNYCFPCASGYVTFHWGVYNLPAAKSTPLANLKCIVLEKLVQKILVSIIEYRTY